MLRGGRGGALNVQVGREGSHSGGLWRFVVFATGILPAVFGITGVMMWLRGRRNRKALRKQRATGAKGALQAAE